MEELSKQKEGGEFDVEKSPIREAYILLEADTPKKLDDLYSAEDQKLMKAHLWDYKNPELVVNKVKEILESVDPQTLTEDERGWREVILWFWYHHAISCAIWRYRDRDTAKIYASKALEYQSPNNNSNLITRLFYLLVNDNLKEAEEWAETIKEEPEKETAGFLIDDYKKGWFS